MNRRVLPKSGEKRGPWKVIESRVMYENEWMRIREDKVIRPDGKDGIYGVAEINPGVMLVALDSEGRTLLTKNFQYGVEKITVKVVSGGIDGEETPLEAAKRELEEETGFKAEEWIDLGLSDPFTALINSPTQLFLARKLKPGIAHLEGTEVMEILWVPFEEAMEMIRTDVITESVSVVTLMKAKVWLEREK